MFIFIICYQIFPQQSVEIDRYGKRTQLDGYLIEWSEKQSKKWDSSGKWFWDVVNTPEGISGYFRSAGAVSCSSWTIIIESSGNEKPFRISFPSDSAIQHSFYRIDQELYKDSSKLVIEWVVPWNDADVDSKGKYALDIRAHTVCGDTLPSIMITGSKEPPKKIITSKIVIQTAVIVLLLILYIFFRIKIRPRKPRKRSLHQEA
jgi:hypothetical protein